MVMRTNSSSLSAVFLAIFWRRFARRLRRLCPLVFALFAVACNGHSVNNRDAEWCVQSEELLAPAIAAANNWYLASDGEVTFSFYRADVCPDDAPRIRYGTPSDDAAAHMTRGGDMVIRHGYGHRVILLHEFGHYLTGPDHDGAVETDVMYGGSSPLIDGQQLTEYDIARLDRPSYMIKEGW